MSRKIGSCHSLNSNTFQPQIKSYFPKMNQVLIDKSIFNECQVLMILDNSYIVIHHEGQIFLVDQHAACQKILYMQNYQKTKERRQKRQVKQKTLYLIQNLYRIVVEQKQKQINDLGWQYRVTQQGSTNFTIEIFKQPYILTADLGSSELIYYLQQMYDNQDTNWTNIKDQIDLSQKEKQIVAEYACHKSYRFGQSISLQKAQQIIKKLSTIQAPFNCPHSRVLISYYGNVKQIGLIS